MKEINEVDYSLISGGLGWALRNGRTLGRAVQAADVAGVPSSPQTPGNNASTSPGAPNCGSGRRSDYGAGSNDGMCRSGPSGGGSSRVICTHFYRKGMIDQQIWRADLEFTFKNLSSTVVRGYHVWAIPYVKLMRRSAIAEKIMFPLAVWRAEELAYKMGARDKGNWRGKIVRAIGEPLCFAMGLFAKEQNWESLWQKPQAATLVENTPAA